eukprot:2168572-Amphidinium_carterae.1
MHPIKLEPFQPGISCCSTIIEEPEAMAQDWAPVFQDVPLVDEGTRFDCLEHAPQLTWPIAWRSP